MKRKIVLILSACIAVASCQPQQEIAAVPETAKLRFAVMTFAHETCTFCPGGDSTIEEDQPRASEVQPRDFG